MQSKHWLRVDNSSTSKMSERGFGAAGLYSGEYSSTELCSAQYLLEITAPPTRQATERNANNHDAGELDPPSGKSP